MGSSSSTGASASSPDLPLAYFGGHRLRRGHYDEHLWPGAPPEGSTEADVVPIWPARSEQQGVETAVGLGGPEYLVLPAYVQRLQQTLRDLGFKTVRSGDVDGHFGRATEQAVREFQIYAGMEQIAQLDADAPDRHEYVRRLTPTPNDRMYEGPISGVVNEETRACLHHWMMNEYRCPVVLTARNPGSKDLAADADLADGAEAANLWRHDDLQDTGPRVFAVDFTGHFDYTGEHTIPEWTDENDVVMDGMRHVVVGDYQTREPWSGPECRPPEQTWSRAEVTPDLLLGRSEDALSDAEASTFQVIHAVAEIECVGFLDAMNAYDRALLSAGVFHWTLALMDRGPEPTSIGSGELGAFLSYLRATDEDAYTQAFERFGPRVTPDWGVNGEALSTGAGKYVAWIEQRRADRQGPSGGKDGPAPYKALDRGERGDADSVGAANRDALYFRSWHWFYRFSMAARTIEGFQRANWDFARMRIRDILDATFSTPEWAENWQGEKTIGDIFTSEMAVAMLLRWHVYRPADVVNGGGATRWVERALTSSRKATSEEPADELVAWSEDPASWGDENAKKLQEKIIAATVDLDEAKDFDLSDLIRTVRRVLEENDDGSLNRDRDSFSLDQSNI